MSQHVDTTKPLPSYGGWVFGSNSGYPIDSLIAVGGGDEFMARMGGEDCNLGIRLENAGFRDRMFYDSRCSYVEDQPLHYSGPNAVDVEFCFRAFKTRTETPENTHEVVFVRNWMNEQIRKHLYDEQQTTPRDPHFNLKAERALYRSTGGFKSVDHITWTDPDGESIETL